MTEDSNELGDDFAEEIQKQFSDLVRVFGPQIEPTLPIDASDVVASAYVQAWISQEQFLGSTRKQLFCWLCEIVKNKLIDKRRWAFAKKRDFRRNQSINAAQRHSSAGDYDLADQQRSPSHLASLREEYVKLMVAAAEHMKPEELRALQLHYQFKMTRKEIAQELGVKESQVSSYLKYGPGKLEKILSAKTATDEE